MINIWGGGARKKGSMFQSWSLQGSQLSTVHHLFQPKTNECFPSPAVCERMRVCVHLRVCVCVVVVVVGWRGFLFYLVTGPTSNTLVFTWEKKERNSERTKKNGFEQFLEIDREGVWWGRKGRDLLRNVNPLNKSQEFEQECQMPGLAATPWYLPSSRSAPQWQGKTPTSLKDLLISGPAFGAGGFRKQRCRCQCYAFNCLGSLITKKRFILYAVIGFGRCPWEGVGVGGGQQWRGCQGHVFTS